ncbi:MAG: transcription antitermination factor NusB [Waddliaceae bacterium]
MSVPDDQAARSLTMETSNPREAAFLALFLSVREESFVTKKIEKWQRDTFPPQREAHLAREIAYGTARMALALDYLASQLADRKKLDLKLKEKILLRTAIYQAYFMNGIPNYAITNETIKIAKKHCHESFVKFLNASLRRFFQSRPTLPKGETVPEISIRYSYPAFFVQELIQDFTLKKACEILEAGNRPGPAMVRIRPQAKGTVEKQEGIEQLAGTLCPIAIIRDVRFLPEISKSPGYYIQNITPAVLMQTLSNGIQEPPKRILDLCASPGGKLLSAYDHFPSANLNANDISPEKIRILSENCEKYGVKATISCSLGQEFTSEQPFDLVIVDVPCSNSGVLNKRPEARWRISKKHLEHLEELQFQLCKHAVDLISDHGEVWYLTCSVLKRENTELIKKVCQQCHLHVRAKETIFPNLDGWDGGFGCAVRKQA